ncbi:MAG: DUF4185 domain-containing protein [Acidimicrobiia bacterium]
MTHHEQTATPESERARRTWVKLLSITAAVIGVGILIVLVTGRQTPLPLGVLRTNPAGPSRPAELPPLWEHLASTSVVGQLTGPGSPNRTYQRWNVGGTDLGHTFFHNGDLYMVFGDTYGLEHGDWRSNTMAKIASLESPATGLEIEHFISDETGQARELLSSQKVYWVERTVIPTNGVSVRGRMILHYMSVRRWVAPGRWSVNHAGLAYSEDDGETWVKSGPMWGDSSNFVQVAFVEDHDDPRHVYMFGIPAGRYGSVALARVPQTTILEADAYEYWDGNDWIEHEALAAQIVPAPVGELSVAWNGYLQRWLMMYLNERLNAVVIRTAEQLTGPWSDESLITTARDHPQLYAPFIVPFESNEPDIFFTMSRWDSYNVFLMHMRVQ